MPISYFSGSMGLSKERYDEIFGKKEEVDTNQEENKKQKERQKNENILQPNQQS